MPVLALREIVLVLLPVSFQNRYVFNQRSHATILVTFYTAMSTVILTIWDTILNI